MISPKTPNIHHRISSFIPKLQNSSQNSKSHLKIISKFHSIIPSLITNFKIYCKFHISSKNFKLHPKIIRFIPKFLIPEFQLPCFLQKFQTASKKFKIHSKFLLKKTKFLPKFQFLSQNS